MSIINFPMMYVPDPVKGRPVGNGQIFVGIPDLDPEVIANQKQLNVVQEDGTVVPVNQPFTLSFGGVPVYNGSTVRLDVDGNYSFKVLSKQGSQLYYIENVFEGQPVTEASLPGEGGKSFVRKSDTLSDAQLLTDVLENNQFNIREHTSGKGGGAIWDVVLTSSGTAGAGFVASAVAGLSLKLRIVEHMNVKQWGMFGGVNEDAIWQDVIASGAINIFLNRGVSYEINELFNITGQNINGNSCNILVTGVNQVYTIAAGSIKNIIFDGNDDDHTAAPSEILASDGVVIDNIRYQNFHGKTSFQTYVLKWEMWGVHNFTINRCRFKNITHDDDGVVIGPGFVGALRMSSEVLGDASDTSYGTISNMRGEHIYSVDAGSGVVQDSDMIRFSWSTVNGDISEMNWDIKFNKITAINVGKRVFKTGGISGCTIKTLRCYKNDGLYGPMFSVINLAADSNRWTVSDAKGTGDFERFLEVSGSDHVISMIQAETFTGGGYGIQYGTVAFPCQRVIASNLNFKGFSSSLYFFDSFDSQANNYVSDSSLGVTTFNKSNGNSNTISNGVHKDSIIITEGSFLFINDCRIEDFPAGGTAYAFDLRDGACRIRGLNISSNSGKRMMNLALMSGQTADIDDVTLFRTGVSDAIANDSNIFSTLDAVIGSQLIVGRLRVVSGANPAGAPGAGDGNALVLFKNVNYTAENIEVKNSAARGTYGTDFRTSTPQGECRLGRLVTQQPVAGGSVVVTNSTGNTYVGTAEIENAFNNTFSVYLGTAVLRGSTLSGVLNAPTTITIP